MVAGLGYFVDLENKQKEEQVKKMYKPFTETPKGGLTSVWAGEGFYRSIGVRLSYKEGEITYNPDGGAGIWVSNSLDEARSQGLGNKNYEGIIVVHEVTPLGDSVAPETGLPYGSIFISHIRYPAVLVGKKVYPEEEPKPEPEPVEIWEDITKECRLEPMNNEGVWLNIWLGDQWLCSFDACGFKEGHTWSEDYAVAVEESGGSRWVNSIHILKKVS